MKHLITVILSIFMAAAYAQPKTVLEASLGSYIGGSETGGNLPFIAEVQASAPLFSGVDLMIVGGHQSTADVRHDAEFQCDYVGAGTDISFWIVSAKATAAKCHGSNSSLSSGDWLYNAAVGIMEFDRVKLQGFYQVSEGQAETDPTGDFEAFGIKASVDFTIFD